MKGPKGPHKATPWVLAVASATRRVSPCSLGAFFPSTHGGTLPGGHPYSCCARRNGRAFSSLTARGGGLPIGVRAGNLILGFQRGVSIPLVKGGVKAPPAKR